MGKYWKCGSYKLDLSLPKVMAVINLTADSFSDGGEHLNVAAAYRVIDEAAEAGAHILDLGAESSRPGALPISEQEEWQRLSPILKYAVKLNIPISVDTHKVVLMQRAIEQGAAIINDIRALQDDGALEAVALSGAGVCLMHMQGFPQTMQHAPQYVDVVSEVSGFLEERVNTCVQNGIEAARIVIDPGIGFGKLVQHNLALLRAIPSFNKYGYPMLVGVSRKSFIGELTQQLQPKDRLSGSLAAALFAVQQGARILRVHDVRATCDALAIWKACNINYSSPP